MNKSQASIRFDWSTARKIFSTLNLTLLSFTTLSSLTFLHLTLLTAFTTSCTIETNSSKQSSLAPPQVESATIENDRLIIHGTLLQSVTSVSIEGIPKIFTIESQSDSQIRAYVTSALKLIAGKSYNVVVASAHAQAVAPITLQLGSLGAENGQVLQFNSVTQTWVPGDLNGLTFLGSWDASSNSPELNDGGISTNPHPGDYYIVTTAGNSLLDGIDSWAQGDWVVYRSDGVWTKIVSHGGVTSFNGRMGNIAPQTGDYALSNLSDVDTSGKTTNSVLKWDGAKWMVDTDDTVASTGVITGTQASGGNVIFHSGTGDSSTEQMRMTSTGLGIGTSSPKSRLTVEGDMTLDQLTTSPTGTSGYGSIYAKTDGKLYFRDGTGSEFDLTSTTDATKLPLSGGTLSGDLDMGGYNILGTGHLILNPGTTINLGTYDNDSEALLTASLGSVDKGKSWFNTTTNEIRYWDGSQAKSLGVAGSGLQSLGGELGSAQLLATGTEGSSPNWSSASDTHTLNIPMASTAGVTAGLISKTDYDGFSGKAPATGSANIITLGTIGTGTWHGDTIDIAYGGTGTNNGSIIGSGALSLTAGSVGADVTLTPGTGGTVILHGGLSLPDAGTPGSGKLLTSDASGMATWETPNFAPPTSGITLLKGNGSGGFSNAVSGTDYLIAESDPYVQSFAKNALPTCSSGEMLKSDGTNLSCVTDNTTDTTKLPLAGGTMTGALILASNGLSVGTNQLVVNNANVGVGTASPSEKLEVTGNVKATAFLYSSDRKLKHNVITCEGALNKIEKLRGVSFTWNEDDSEDIGFIAQEVEEVEPRLVVTNKQNGLKSVKYGNIVALLVEAMKEQNLEVARLKEENEKDINKLKNQNKLLKDFLCQKEPEFSLCLEK